MRFLANVAVFLVSVWLMLLLYQWVWAGVRVGEGWRWGVWIVASIVFILTPAIKNS